MPIAYSIDGVARRHHVSVRGWVTFQTMGYLNGFAIAGGMARQVYLLRRA